MVITSDNNDKLRAVIQKQQEIIQMLMDTCPNTDIEPAPDQPIVCVKKDVAGFTEWLTQKALSPNSIDSYTRQVKIYFDKYKEISVPNLTAYEESFCNFSPKTANIKIVAMEKYFSYIGYTGYKFKKLKIQKQSFCDNAINEKQYNQLISYAKEHSPKTWLICKVIAGTGVRVSELITLKTSDLSRGYTDIIGKGSKQRRIYFPKSLVDEIRDSCGNVYIIENKKGQQMTTRGVSELIHENGIKSGIPVKVCHPHSFRHFFAKQFVRNKNDIALLGDLLGHSSISTTAIYTRMTSEEQQEEINKIIDW